MNYDLVTVTHLEEEAAMRLQARSLGRFLAPARLGRIWVVLNDRCDDRRFHAFSADLLDRYGPLRHRVHIVRGDELCPGLEGFAGYVSQQILKLRLAALIEPPRYVVLDSKNFAIGPVGPGYFFADGHPKARFETYADNFQAYIINSYYGFLGVPPADRVFLLPAMMTPFGFARHRVQRVVKFVETTLERSLEGCFADLFAPANLVSEFLLFSVALQAQGVPPASIYTSVPQLSTPLWTGYAVGPAALQGVLVASEAAGINIVGIHHKRRRQMDQLEQAALNGFLAERGILPPDTQTMDAW